jgi:RHS repeat-associated protein
MVQAGAVTYSYDGLDRVVSRTVSGVSTPFSYAGVEPDPVSVGASKFLRGPSGQSVYGVVRGGVMSFAGVDRRGDVSFTMSVTGAVSDSVVRDPFGKTLGSTGSAPDVGFQSDWTDPVSGLVWMGARWYQPGTGTFVSRDTVAGSVGAYASMNRFTYGLNNPVLFNDPTGRVAAPVGCDNACHSEYLQRTGELYGMEDDSYNGKFQNGDYEPTVEIYEDAENGPTFIVQSPSGITLSTPGGTQRSYAGGIGVAEAASAAAADRTGTIENEAEGIRQGVALAYYSASAGSPTTTLPPSKKKAASSCSDEANNDPSTAGIYSSAKACGYDSADTAAEAAAKLRAAVAEKLRNGAQVLGHWWKKNGKYVTTAFAVVGLVTCIVGTLGACTAVAFVAAAVDTAGNVGLYSIGEKSGKRLAVDTAINIGSIALPGAAAAEKQMATRQVEYAGETMNYVDGKVGAALSGLGYGLQNVAARGVAIAGQATLAGRSLICSWNVEASASSACY